MDILTVKSESFVLAPHCYITSIPVRKEGRCSVNRVDGAEMKV